MTRLPASHLARPAALGAVLGAGALVLLSAADSFGSSPADDPDLLYWCKRVMTSEGVVDEEVWGTNTVTLSDGTEETIDDSLVDSEGGRYTFTVDLSRDAADGPVTVEMRLTRKAKKAMTDEERLDAFLRANPDATEDDITGFKARVAAGPTVPDPVFEVDDALLDWLETADALDTVDVLIGVTGAGPLQIPRLPTTLFALEPSLALDVWEERRIAIEERKTEVYELQTPLVDALEADGAILHETLWKQNAILATVSPDTLLWLLEHPDVLRLERVGLDEPMSNDGQEIRDAIDVQQFLDAGLDGSQPSGIAVNKNGTSISTMYVGVLDIDLDYDHPAFEDGSGNSRLLDAWIYSGGAWVEDTGSGATGSSHGTLVAGQLLGDLTLGQDSTYSGSGTTDQWARTGMSTRPVFSFIDWNSASTITAMQFAQSDFTFDVVNMSAGCAVCSCSGNEEGYDREANDLYIDGAFFVLAAGNNGHTGSCSVVSPADAAGAFTVGALNISTTPLTSSSASTVSSRGGGPSGSIGGTDRSIVSLVAPSGRQGSTLPNYNNTYSAVTGGQTSYAAPTLAGAAVDLKHHLYNIMGSGANNVGWMHATLLNMGDGALESGTPGAVDALDSLYGVGRLAMRRFHSTDLGVPWRARWNLENLDDADTDTILFNPDGSGVNQSLSNSVDTARVAAWWYEPNLGSTEDPAEITTEVCCSTASCCTHSDCTTSTCFTYPTTNDQKRRFRIDDEGSFTVGGKAWSVTHTGDSVPAGTDDHHWTYTYQYRTVATMLYWENAS